MKSALCKSLRRRFSKRSDAFHVDARLAARGDSFTLNRNIWTTTDGRVGSGIMGERLARRKHRDRVVGQHHIAVKAAAVLGDAKWNCS